MSATRLKIISRRRFLTAAAGAAGAAGLYAWRIEPHWLEIVQRPLPFEGLPRDLRGRSLVQISDLHIGPRVDDAYLIASLQRVAVLRPDIVVVTGDFISYSTVVFDQVVRVLSHLPLGRLATTAILGNHDYGPAWRHPEIGDRLAHIVQSLGIDLLRNDVREVAGLQIAGLDDLWGPRFAPESALSGLDRRRASLVLGHNPDLADLSIWSGIRGWILSGHTHGGQCKPPFLPPPLLPVRNKRYTAGEFTLPHGRRLYINRGLGHLLPVRFNVRPEITVFTLTAT